jgi:hypothetical protein
MDLSAMLCLIFLCGRMIYSVRRSGEEFTSRST